MISFWKIFKNTLLPVDILQIPSVDSLNQIKRILNKQNYFFASYTSNFDQKEVSDFWYIINDVPMALEAYPTKVRNEIRQSLQKCQVEIVDPTEHWDTLFRLYNLAVDGYKHYNYRYSINQFKEKMMSQINKIDIWLIKNSQSIPIGYGYVIKNNEYVDLFDIKINPSQLSCLPVFHLLYKINIHYLVGNNFQFISDGRKSMLHDTQFQTFLEKKFLYRKAYCRLHIIYSSKIKLLIQFLRPFKILLLALPKIGPIRKLALLLNYDHIARSVQ